MVQKSTKLSPLVRLTLSFDKELNLDRNGVFGRETYEKYIERHQEVLVKQDQLIRSLVMLNAILFLILSGQNWVIPGIGVQVSTIPAIHEILLFMSSMTFYFLCAFFVTSQCYSGVIDEFGNRIVDSNLIDPDFFNASRKHYDFFLKLYRPKLNIWGDDFFQHGRGFAVFSGLMNTIMIAVILIFPATHLLMVLNASIQVLQSDWNQYGKWFLLVSVGVINLGGLAMVIGMTIDFTFKPMEHPSDEDSQVDAVTPSKDDSLSPPQN